MNDAEREARIEALSAALCRLYDVRPTSDEGAARKVRAIGACLKELAQLEAARPRDRVRRARRFRPAA